MDQSLGKCSEGLSGRMSANQGDGRPQDGQVVEVSPIAYDENNMPRTVNASRFLLPVLEAEKLKTQIIKLCEKMEEHIEDIKEAEQEESQNEEESPYYVKKWADVEEQFNKVEEYKTEHEDLVCKIRLMCEFMLKQGGEEARVSNLQNDAQEALIDAEKAELEVERVVRKFKKTNKIYVRGRKKKQTSQVNES